MSEEIKKNETRETYVVEINPVEFNASFATKLTTSMKLSDLANEYFTAAFEGYQGCVLEMNNGQPTFSLYFDHDNHQGIVACSKEEGALANDTLLNKVRSRDRQLREGDRFYITKDGEDIIKPLLLPRLVDNKGKVNWKQIVADVVDPIMPVANAGFGIYQPRRQSTKITGIDPARLCQLLFGAQDEDGRHLDYVVGVVGTAGAVNATGTVSNYVLQISRTYYENLLATYDELGINSMASGFVRAKR
jgi:hypothetical protein